MLHVKLGRMQRQIWGMFVDDCNAETNERGLRRETMLRQMKQVSDVRQC